MLGLKALERSRGTPRTIAKLVDIFSVVLFSHLQLLLSFRTHQTLLIAVQPESQGRVSPEPSILPLRIRIDSPRVYGC